jgi:hypothetical protein
VSLRCIPSCKRSNRRTKVSRGRRQASFLRLNLLLARFAKLEIAVGKRGRIGRFAQFAPGRRRGTLRRARRGCMSAKQVVDCRTGRPIGRRESGTTPTCTDCNGADPVAPGSQQPAPRPGSPSPSPTPAPSPSPAPPPAVTPAATGNGWFQMVGADLYFIKTRNTGSGAVEVHTATAASGYRSGQHSVTRFSPGDAANGWFQMVGSDLYFVKSLNTGSGSVEIHSVTSSSGYQSGPSSASWFSPADAGNGTFHVVGADLYFVKTLNTGSGSVEVHLATAASGYTTPQSHISWFSSADAGNGRFHMNGTDLFFVKTQNTGSGSVEVHSATSGSGYKSGESHATWFSPGDAAG